MKKIKIFLASSIEEFKEERNELGRFILGINNLNLERGIYCHLELCENYDSSISARKRKQDDYNEFIKGADAVFVLFCEKAGDYTVEELKLAKNCFRDNGKPKVYTYFKNFDENNLTDEVRKAYELIKDEYKHFFGTFESVAAIEVDILRAMFEICPNDALEVRENEGVVYIGNEPIMVADELDYIKNNNMIEELKNRIAGLRAGDKKYTEGFWGEEIDEEIERCEKKLKDRYDNCFKALEARYKSISSAIETDYELQATYNASANGNYDMVIKILDPDKMKKETEKEIMVDKINHKRYLGITFEKYKQLINALTHEKKYDELEKNYEDAVNAIKKLHLYELEPKCLDVWFDFVFFLVDINKDLKAIETGEELLRTYDFMLDACDEYDKACLYNFLGILFKNQNQPQKAEKYFSKLIDTIKNFNEDSFKPTREEIAMLFNNIGAFYSSQQNYDLAKSYYDRSKEILETLYIKNQRLYLGNLVALYGNMGMLFLLKKILTKLKIVL